MNLLFNIQQVVNHSFQIQHFKTDTFKDADRIYHAYIKFNKNGLIYNLSAIVERYLRIIAKELDSTIDISKGIFDIRKKIFEIVCISKTGNEWNALNLLTAIRNTIHNNGIYVNPSLTKLDDSFSYRNSIYSFVNNTPHNYATYENLNDIINDILSLVKIINNNQVIVTKESFIDDCIYL
ncbi:hypothetical protein B0O44_104526 [Pedobacter nutrimenti]|uniref:Uncharacterized protein n=2 Tax=Pedobacter nutrimenti TaxID=1241337 RepID=A0A318UK42_9SPHI|nr:hypothetical protein B0O44_104526 [Pedobacter nutrimenti]